MKSENWSGLITNASPYALPPGAAVEQVNLHNAIPGQLTSRDGMRLVSHLGDRASFRDIVSVYTGSSTFLLVSSGNGLFALESPGIGDPAGTPAAAAPDSTGGVFGSNYLLLYEGYGEGAVDGGGGGGATGSYISGLDGGTATTAAYEFELNANLVCQGDGKRVDFDGGRADTALYPLLVRESELCEAPPVEAATAVTAHDGSRIFTHDLKAITL